MHVPRQQQQHGLIEKCSSLVYVAVLTVPGYEVRVNRSPVFEGNDAVLSCTAREDIKEHLTVTSWYRDESILLPGSTDTGTCISYILYVCEVVNPIYRYIREMQGMNDLFLAIALFGDLRTRRGGE